MEKLTSKERYFMMMDYIKEHRKKERFDIKFKEEDLLDLIDFLHSNFKGEFDFLIPYYNSVELYGENFNLYLRSSEFPVHTLTIGRIRVYPTGRGLGTALVKKIVKYAKKFGFDRIVLENVLSEEGLRLAEKNGFKKVFKFDEVKKMFPSGPDSYELLLDYEFNEIVQVRLKELMSQHNMNGYKIGKYIKENYGVSFQSTLSEIINGRSQMPKLNTIEWVMEALDLPLEDFFIDWKFYYYRLRMKGNLNSSIE